MSTQTEKTPAQLAEEFLRKYATVIGTLEAIDKSDKTFLLKYATVVGSPKAIEDLPDPGQPAIISDDETPEVPVVPPTDPEDEGTETGDIGGEGMEDEGVENE
jgi:hypothetical protein